MKNKAVIVTPPFVYSLAPPQGPACIASFMEEKGYETVQRDLNTEIRVRGLKTGEIWKRPDSIDGFLQGHMHLAERWAGDIIREDPLLVGFYLWDTSLTFAREIALLIKKERPDAYIVCGGPSVKYTPETKELFASSPWADAFVMGEGENTLADIAELLKNKIRPLKVKGALLRSAGGISDGGRREEIKDLDSLPFADFSPYEPENYMFPDRLPVYLGRGCIRDCLFCDVGSRWKKYRHRSPGRVAEEVLYQKKRHPRVNHFEFTDPAVNIVPSALSKLCGRFIDSGLEFSWGGFTIVHPGMTEELWEKMYRSGCRNIGMGLESGSTRILRSIGKSYDPEVASRNMREAHQAGIDVGVSFIVGFPDETEEDFRETLSFIEKNREYIDLLAWPGNLRIESGSGYGMNPDIYGIKTGDEWSGPSSTPEIRRDREEHFVRFAESLGLKTVPKMEKYYEISGTD